MELIERRPFRNWDTSSGSKIERQIGSKNQNQPPSSRDNTHCFFLKASHANMYPYGTAGVSFLSQQRQLKKKGDLCL